MNFWKIIRQQPLSFILLTIIWTACMVPVPETPLSNATFIDKWAHAVMFGLLASIIMWEYTHKNSVKTKPLLLRGMVIPIIMGGFVELAQAYLTNGTRSGDWFDFLADSIGVLTACAIGIPLALFRTTHDKDA